MQLVIDLSLSENPADDRDLVQAAYRSLADLIIGVEAIEDAQRAELGTLLRILNTLHEAIPDAA